MNARLTVDVRLGRDEIRAALGADVWRGLTSEPKELPPKWFYDERGSQLFDEITRLPEYYLTRAEREILDARAGEIVAASGADTLVELGSGTSEKTRLLLDALAAGGRLTRFGALDVSEETLRAAGAAIAGEYPGVAVHAVVGDFDGDLAHLPAGGRRMVAFLGSTIGNLPPGPRAAFLGRLKKALRPGDSFLVGTDLVKDVARLERAYDDAAGVTAEFNRNVLRVVNRELQADFVPERFAHVARYDRQNDWIEMWLRSTEAQVVTVPPLGLKVDFAAGEEMRTEISAKFRPDSFRAEVTAAGLRETGWWTDAAGDFALSLWER